MSKADDRVEAIALADECRQLARSVRVRDRDRDLDRDLDQDIDLDLAGALAYL